MLYKTGLPAEAAIERVQQRTRTRMRQIDDPLLADRMHDLEDLSNRLLRIVSGQMGTAAQLGLRVVNVVFNNGIYGTIRLHQEREYPGRVSGTTIWSPDFGHYARAFGGFGATVERTEDFGAAFEAAAASGLPSIVHVKFDPDGILAPGFIRYE